MRCRELAIGYSERTIATGIDLEVDHGTRAAIVGDNGQGKTTLLRTLVGGLVPLAGAVRWGHGCTIGTYAQHVYTSLDEGSTVLEHLERAAAVGTPSQRILDVAGALLFRGTAVGKRVAVLSGGERARLCLAGLLLGACNVLVLDEPGNHLDVETVDALAEALVDYRGTVIFTSHDRSFMRAVATHVLEVRDGRVRTVAGGYDAYLAAVTTEVAAGERVAGERVAGGRAAAGNGRQPRPPRANPRPPGGDDRAVRKEIANLERSMNRLDAERQRLAALLLAATDPAEALRLHEEAAAITARLAAAEDRWLALQEQAGHGG